MCDRSFRFFLLVCLLIPVKSLLAQGAENDYPMHTNRLIQEKSPYLLQHAHNPVDWYPWGKEAFERARSEAKPIFLSIGYSTCHWCHVMEEESFENKEVAEIMNENFIAVKVDREERPDVDQIYMQAVMAMTGSGGWPLSVFLTPDLKPFYGGTYFPPEDRWGRPGFVTLLKAVSEKWQSERDKILESGNQIAQLLQEQIRKETGSSESLNEDILKKTFEQFQAQYDPDQGGFGPAPKFPRSHSLSFLLRYWKRTQEQPALEMVEKTLKAMSQGGMYDHLGGGFHRYSTDGEWHVPHFEKMLYDQAILARSYLEAYQATGNVDYAQTAREIFDYVLRDLTHPDGGFYSAEDADSAPDANHPREKSEGAFYIWSEEEILQSLGNETGMVFNFYFDVSKHGNAAQDPQGEFKDKNILRIIRTLDETAERFGQRREEIDNVLRQAKETLLKIRGNRLRPHLDDKVLTDWNGLMISSLAFGSRVLNDVRYRDAARKAADFVLEKMKSKNGRLMHRWREGETAVSAFLEDYAFFTLGLVDLYEATFEPHYLEEAKFFAGEMIRLFWDDSHGGFYFVGKDAEQLISQVKEIYDGAIPSGNSVAVLALAKIGRLTMNRDLEKKARETVDAFSSQLSNFPSGYPQMMIGLDFLLGPSKEIVLAGRREDSEFQKMLGFIFRQFLPNKVVAYHPLEPSEAAPIRKLIPFLEKQISFDGKPTAYVCENYVCKLPVVNLTGLEKVLGS